MTFRSRYYNGLWRARKPIPYEKAILLNKFQARRYCLLRCEQENEVFESNAKHFVISVEQGCSALDCNHNLIVLGLDVYELKNYGLPRGLEIDHIAVSVRSLCCD